MSSVLKVDNIEKYYGSKANLTKAIDRISFEVEKGEYIGIREMRKHVAWYTKGYPNSARLRDMVNEMETFEQLEEGINRIFQAR